MATGLSHPPDFGLSPYTGWTRAHWEATADRMLCSPCDRTRALATH